jgi:ABC-type multidrug transport system ATPase subunit
MSLCGPSIDLYADLTCADNVGFIASLRGVEMPDIAALLEGAGLPDVAGQAYGSLSSGQKQRMRLISSTFFHPDLLFLDEPGSNLDRQGADVVRGMIADRRGRGWMTVLATNDAEELALCDATIRLGPN